MSDDQTTVRPASPRGSKRAESAAAPAVDAAAKSAQETSSGDYREGVIGYDGDSIAVDTNSRVANPYYVDPAGVDQDAANAAQAAVVAAIRAERGE